MKISRVINIEDDSIKHMAIKRALEKNRVDIVDWARNAEEGLCKIEQAVQEQNPYDLLITDMHFPVNGKEDPQAGLYVIEELKGHGIQMPIVVCSSVRYRMDEIAGCIFYNQRSGDLEGDIREILGRL